MRVIKQGPKDRMNLHFPTPEKNEHLCFMNVEYDIMEQESKQSSLHERKLLNKKREGSKDDTSAEPTGGAPRGNQDEEAVRMLKGSKVLSHCSVHTNILHITEQP